MTSVRAIREPSGRDGACRPPTITQGWCGSIAARCGARGSPSSSNPPFFTPAIFRHPVTHPSGLPGIRSVRRIAHRNVRDPFLDINGCLQPVVPGPGKLPSITRASRPCRDLEAGVVARFGPTTPTSPGLPLALRRLDRRSCCFSLFAPERLSLLGP